MPEVVHDDDGAVGHVDLVLAAVGGASLLEGRGQEEEAGLAPAAAHDVALWCWGHGCFGAVDVFIGGKSVLKVECTFSF